MEGIRPGVEANFGFAAGQARWRALLAADYFTHPLRDQRCPLCHATRLLSCGNRFCMDCNLGGLCRAQFRTGGDHENHPHIQVYKVTHELALRVDDLKEKDGNPALLNVGQLHRLQKYLENGKLHCKLFGPYADTSIGGRQCTGCSFRIAETGTPNLSTHPMCSIQCLLDYALVERREADRMLASARQPTAARELAARARIA